MRAKTIGLNVRICTAALLFQTWALHERRSKYSCDSKDNVWCLVAQSTQRRPPLLCMDHHCTNVWVTKVILWQRLPFFSSSQYSSSCSCTGLQCVHTLTQYWGGQSIETAVTADHLRKSEQCFLFEWACSNPTTGAHPLREGQVSRSQCKCPTVHSHLFHPPYLKCAA